MPPMPWERSATCKPCPSCSGLYKTHIGMYAKVPPMLWRNVSSRRSTLNWFNVLLKLCVRGFIDKYEPIANHLSVLHAQATPCHDPLLELVQHKPDNAPLKIRR